MTYVIKIYDIKMTYVIKMADDIIIVRICLTTLRLLLFIAFIERKHEGTIQYGCNKCGTHARESPNTRAWKQQE